MSWMQFLAVGRSLDRIDDSPNRYRMTQQNLLPKFGSSRPTEAVRRESRPFSGASETKTAAPRDARPNRATDGPVKAGWMTKVFRKLQFRNPMQAINPGVKAATLDALPAPACPLGRWAMFSGVSLFKNPFGKTPKPKIAQQALQTELLLDTIKPVRNDLSDCDLEIVSARERTTQIISAKKRVDPPEELASVGASQKNPELAWGRIKTQFFGAGKP